MQLYRDSLYHLCQELQLRGRILIGCSETEGINGTLADQSYSNVFAFTQALLHTNVHPKDDDSFLQQFRTMDPPLEPRQIQALQRFWKESAEFFRVNLGHTKELCMDSPEDFKWSSIPFSKDSAENVSVFPDLHIQLVSELINTGGVLREIPIPETSIGYLSPKEWHDQLSKSEKPIFLLDCRNQKEYQLGHFMNAQQPGITTFSQFLPWVQRNQALLLQQQQEESAVYMYCTGGIRCEKASAYIRRELPQLTVYHLQGGIHKYLEAYPENDPSSLWQGRNFVFDGRDTLSTAEDEHPPSSRIVGQCIYCSDGYDRFDPHCVCTVCREPILICPTCQTQYREYHCVNHFHLKNCYFTNLQGYSDQELQEQMKELASHVEDIAIGRRFKQKRKTLQKQIDRLLDRLQQSPTALHLEEAPLCRNCGDMQCDGRCWGFFGLKRKERLETQQHSESKDSNRPEMSKRRTVDASCRVGNMRTSGNLPKSRRDNSVQLLWNHLNVRLPSHMYRDAVIGIRVPPCCIKMLQCAIKAKWCGQSILDVLQNEFIELRKPHVLQDILEHGLLRYNGQAIFQLARLTSTLLKSSDTLGRIVHWHEAPVLVPELIAVEASPVPKAVLETYRATPEDDGMIYICNKPSTVPTHPTGPYLANSLTLMVEGQLSLTQSLHPLHRTDRVTSGLTLCTTSAAVSRAFHRSLTEGTVDKLYLAKVKGRFPATAAELQKIFEALHPTIGRCDWSEEGKFVVVDAPIYTMDPAAGIRTIDTQGKSSQSYFQHLSYDGSSDTTLLLCSPVTGRNHQLRVHLQWLGFPILNDVQYGGRRDASQEELNENTVTEAMMQASQHPELERRMGSLSDADAAAARQACPCCRPDGIRQSFTRAQLLLEGHAICLHALRYRVRILPPKPTIASNDAPLAELNFQVHPPSWAHLDPTEATNLSWLTRSPN